MILSQFQGACRNMVNPGRYPKIVPACHGATLLLPLTREDSTPHAAKQRRYPPEEEAMIQSMVTRQFQAGAIRRSTSAWAANRVVVRKKDGTARVRQDYRGLNIHVAEVGQQWPRGYPEHFRRHEGGRLIYVDRSGFRLYTTGNRRGRQTQDGVPGGSRGTVGA